MDMKRFVETLKEASEIGFEELEAAAEMYDRVMSEQKVKPITFVETNISKKIKK